MGLDFLSLTHLILRDKWTDPANLTGFDSSTQKLFVPFSITLFFFKGLIDHLI